MFNIKFKGKYIDEKQIKTGCLPNDAVIFNEPNTITKALILGLIISTPIIILISVGILIKIEFKNITPIIWGCSLLISIILMYIHEIIHALCFPKSVEKQIWVKLKEGALFVYCNEPLSKNKFIWMCAAPNIILGIIPYILFISGVLDFNINLSNIIALVSWIMIIAGVGDYLNIYNTIKQVPKGGKVLNYGFNSFWIK